MGSEASAFRHSAINFQIEIHWNTISTINRSWIDENECFASI